jgi:serine/threonine protein kinase
LYVGTVLQPGTRLALRYLVVRHLGSGGIGSTWLVRDLLDDSPVALKLLHHRTTDALAALRREFTLLRGLVHPHLARVHDFGSVPLPSSPSPYYTSDFIDGIPMLDFARGRPFDHTLPALLDALGGLAHLHRLGIRHGDVTPSNILVKPDGHATLIDLSCAVPLASPPSDSVSGTPGYLAPEVLQGLAADARADVFSVGVLLQHLSEASSAPASAHVMRLAHQCARTDPSGRPPSVLHVLDGLGAPAHEPQAIYVPPARLVGRDQPWSVLRQELEALLTGQPGARRVCLSGGEGVGRTRLLQELKWEAQLRFPVVEGSPRRALPIHDLISRALATPVNPTFRALLETAEQLARSTTPVVLVFDDVHLLDPAAQQALMVLARALSPQGNVLLAWSSIAPDALPEQTLHIDLQPLDETSIRSWPQVPARHASRLLAWTGGFPAAIVALLSQMTAQASDLRDLAPPTRSDAFPPRRQALVRQLAPDHQAALAVLAVLEDALAEDAAQVLSIGLDTLSDLAVAGLAKRDTDGWRLVRAVEAPHVRAALGETTIRGAHEAIASFLQPQLEVASMRGRTAPRLVEHLCRAGSVDRATDLMRAGVRETFREPTAWRHAALAVAESCSDVGVRLLCAEVLTKAGRGGPAGGGRESGPAPPPPTGGSGGRGRGRPAPGPRTPARRGMLACSWRGPRPAWREGKRSEPWRSSTLPTGSSPWTRRFSCAPRSCEAARSFTSGTRQQRCRWRGKFARRTNWGTCPMSFGENCVMRWGSRRAISGTQRKHGDAWGRRRRRTSGPGAWTRCCAP